MRMRFHGFVRAMASLAAVLALSRGPAAAAANDPAPPRLRLPRVAEPAGYVVDLTIDPGQVQFRGVVDIDVRVNEMTDVLWLNAKDLKVEKVSVSLAGRTAAVRTIPGGDEFIGFAFDRAIEPGALKLHVAYTGTLDETSTQGLFRQKDGEDWYAFSQFESTDARRAFPCFDEPGYKVAWQLTLRIPKGTSAVSNTPVASETEEGGLRVVRFGKTPPLPSYLIALGVGPFDYVDAGRAGARKTPIRIVAPRGEAAQARYAAQTTGPLLERLEAYFGIPYPYEKLDQLAIPQTVTFGAMENAGLITWSERILIAPPAEETINFQRVQASINAHEMAHQWFGDLVTLAWWDDVWLNESFATWMADRTLIEWKPEWHEDVARVQASSNVMFEDVLVTARKVRQEIESNDDIVNAFDAITYQKGAAVLTMFESWVGVEKFRTGVHDYLEAHKFGSATERDFLQAIESASRPGVAAAFSTFLDQPGVPVIEVSLDCAGAAGRLGLAQKRLLPIGSRGSTGETWRVPVCVRAESDGAPARACALLADPKGSTPAPTAGCPSWVMANDGELGYYRALYKGDLLNKLLSVADSKLSLAERVGLIRDVNALGEAGAIPMSDALALVPRFAGDPVRHIVGATLRIADDIQEHLVAPDLRPNYARFISKMYGQRARSLGFTPRPGEDDDTRLLRSSMVPFAAEEGEERELQAEAKRLSLAWLQDRKAIDAELAGEVLQVAARFGDRALFERFREAAKTSQERRDRSRLYRALGRFTDPALLKEAFQLALSPDLDSRETGAILFSAARSQAGREPVWEFVKANFDPIIARMPRESTGEAPFVAAGFCDAAHRKDTEAFFQGRIDKLPGGPRALAQVLEGVDLCIASRAAQEGSVREFLKKY
ncbi:MAG: M1 family metallopeptidase [Acidobacteriota bacterium]